MKIILSVVVLFALLHNASAQTQPIDTRKYFEYTDTSFEVGEVKIFNGIEYNFAGTVFTPHPIPSLDSLVTFLNLHRELHVEIGCYTDNTANHKYNLKLTEKRAESDYNYLIWKGVPYWRLAYKGYGETNPIAPNQINGKAYAEGQQLNRTEVKIISTSPPQKISDSRKHFEYTDTSFQVGEVKMINVYYDFDIAQIRPESYPTLDSILNFLYYYPELSIEVGCYTDNKGNDKYNFKLSQARAQGVVDFFLYKGISSDRLSTKGYGETFPIALNETSDGKDNPEGRQLNRRTELKITSIVSLKEKFIRPSILNPPIAVTHFLFGEKTSAFPLSLFNVRAIENILDEYKQVDTSFISHYKSFARSYTGFINAAGDSIVMATLNFSSPPVSLPKNSVFNSSALNSTRVLFINLSKKIYLTPVPSNRN